VTEKERLAPRIANLRRRAVAMRALREWFATRGFLEVETPLMVPSPGLELHLDAFAVEKRYLITSPEYQLKRLLAAGIGSVYSVCKCFRRGEAGAHHNPEFTMVEWYRSPGTWWQIARDVQELIAHVVGAVRGSSGSIQFRDRTIDLSPPWRELSVADAMKKWAKVECAGDEPAATLAARGRAAGWPVPETLTAWDDVFFSIFLHAVEPELEKGPPTILHSWPKPLAALARLDGNDPRVAERFEAYVGGLELANGFGELLDPVEQRARFAHELSERRTRGLPEYPVDERFLDALSEGIPPSGGVALGVDRLIMLACDAASLREVVTFTTDEL
jgi:lysyl-tRNA synthetase class 2